VTEASLAAQDPWRVKLEEARENHDVLTVRQMNEERMAQERALYDGAAPPPDTSPTPESTLDTLIRRLRGGR
jgi:hypothetical protein